MTATFKPSRWLRLRELLRPPRTLKVTRTGRTYLVITLGVGLGALNTGNNLLYLLLGILLSIIVVSGVLSESCLRNLKVRRLPAEGVFAQEPFAQRYALVAASAPAFALVLREEAFGLEGSAQVAMVAPRSETIARADCVAARRGPLTLSRLRVTTTFPFGLFAKTRVYDLPGMILVFPRRGFTCVLPASQPEQGLAGEAPIPHQRDGTGDLLGLRELKFGEDARRVHWVKSATVGKLLRVEREREERRQYLLSLDDASYADQLERRCEEAAGVAHRLLAQGHEVGLRTSRVRLRPAAGSPQERRVLTALAWAGFPAPGEEPHDQ